MINGLRRENLFLQKQYNTYKENNRRDTEALEDKSRRQLESQQTVHEDEMQKAIS